jgi:hypothetical protein
MIDIVTVVFQEELEILRVQAQSIDLFCTPDLVQDIIVVVNDSAEVADAVDPAWWGQFCSRVRIIPREKFGLVWSDNGWVSQQALKLLGSAQAWSPWAQVMDAKTILVKPVTQQLWDDAGRIRTGSLDIYPVFYPARDIVNRLFNSDLNQQIGPGGVPFFFVTDAVRSMLHHIETQTAQSFAPWFQEQGRLTEFILYSGYINATNRYSQCYNFTDNSVRPVNICHSEMGIFDIKLQGMSDNNPISVSVHRRAWAQATADQQQRYREFLTSRGITTAAEIK